MLHPWGSAADLILSDIYLNENERYKTNTNLFMNINNNTAPFILITWHQKEPLGCVVFSHCTTNDSYNKFIHSCCLPCNYDTKSFSILRRVIKSQNVCISFGHIESFKSKKIQTIPICCFFFFVHVRKCNLTSNCTWKVSNTLSDGFTLWY